ncbi:nuclear transport factor 2-like isoform X2 [Impatiens glandulifera]|uniref:nuclear transport factor 2-like isoform X2 n=1 Tax=Impatiens glandulifera TaxID=253017 RepID=UPI001FB196DB|nr:nuclear transport factor 2-like isoform X2 [Impatiens glandulifera]
MTMQEASPAASAIPSAQVVGNAFVDQYYHILHQSPELVFKFYQDSSILSRPDANGGMTTVTTVKAINEKILSLNYGNYTAEIKNADSQDSHQSGVIVLVTGYLTGKENGKRKFAQSFFLAPQEKGYFVLNDVFRYVDETEELEAGSTSGRAIDNSVEVPPVTPDQEIIPVADHTGDEHATNLEVQEINNDTEVYHPSDHDEGSVIDDEVIVEPSTQFDQNESDLVNSSDLLAQEEKKSYASIVKVTKVHKAPAPVYKPTNKVRAVPSNTNQRSLSPVKASPDPESVAPIDDKVPENITSQEEEVEGHSIYVRNLPLNATVPMLDEEFKQFGPIKRGGIQVRSNQGFCFGFVEFEALESMQNAIKASPLTIGNRKSVVEEKKTTTRVNSSPRGRYLSARGGFRGTRGNFGGGRRGFGGRNDYRNQGSRGGGGGTRRNVEGGGYQRVEQKNETTGGGGGGGDGADNKSVAAAAVSA